jgi:hypothetical protein
VNSEPQGTGDCRQNFLYDPGAPRVFGNIEMQHPSPAVFEEEKTIQDASRALNRGRIGDVLPDNSQIIREALDTAQM